MTIGELFNILEPCPWCAARPKFEMSDTLDGSKVFLQVYCDNNRCSVAPGIQTCCIPEDFDESVDKLISDWNTRTYTGTQNETPSSVDTENNDKRDFNKTLTADRCLLCKRCTIGGSDGDNFNYDFCTDAKKDVIDIINNHFSEMQKCRKFDSVRNICGMCLYATKMPFGIICTKHDTKQVKFRDTCDEFTIRCIECSHVDADNLYGDLTCGIYNNNIENSIVECCMNRPTIIEDIQDDCETYDDCMRRRQCGDDFCRANKDYIQNVRDDFPFGIISECPDKSTSVRISQCKDCSEWNEREVRCEIDNECVGGLNACVKSPNPNACVKSPNPNACVKSPNPNACNQCYHKVTDNEGAPYCLCHHKYLYNLDVKICRHFGEFNDQKCAFCEHYDGDAEICDIDDSHVTDNKTCSLCATSTDYTILFEYTEDPHHNNLSVPERVRRIMKCPICKHYREECGVGWCYMYADNNVSPISTCERFEAYISSTDSDIRKTVRCGDCKHCQYFVGEEFCDKKKQNFTGGGINAKPIICDAFEKGE